MIFSLQDLHESFNPNVVGTDIIDEVSLITTSSHVGGDVRYALDLLFMQAIWQKQTEAIESH